MTSSSTEFQQIWIEQRAATEDIREHFGRKNALEYLIGEKPFTFVTASEQVPNIAAESPEFVSEIPAAVCTRRIPRVSQPPGANDVSWLRRSRI